jgi:tetratricopeptide (TPR) repeat protein
VRLRLKIPRSPDEIGVQSGRLGDVAGTLQLGILLISAVTAIGAAQNGVAQASRNAPTFASLSSRAESALKADRLDEAESLYKRALGLRPRWTEGWWSLGTIAYDRDSYPDAERAFRRVTDLAPNNGNAFVMLGLTEFELGHDSLSLQHLEKGMHLGIDESDNLRQVALYHRGVLLQRTGKFQAAKETLEQLCMQGVESAAEIRVLGMVLVRSRSKQIPADGSEDAVILDQVGHGGCLAGQKKFDDARQVLRAVVAGHPKYPNIHYAFGLVLLAANQQAQAEGQFKEEIENNPSDLVSRLQIAAALYKTNSAEGRIYAKEAVKIAPREPFAHYLNGMLLLDTGDYQAALPELQIAHKAYPREAKIYIALASAYSGVGKRQQAAQIRAEFARVSQEKSASSSSPESHSEPSEEIGMDSVDTDAQ